jgi:hypothetical protein
MRLDIVELEGLSVLEVSSFIDIDILVEVKD